MAEELFVAFCFIVRDGEKYLEENLRQIIGLANRFKEYRVYFVENDSTDKTIEILQSFMDADSHITGDFLKEKNVHSSQLCPKINFNCSERTCFLAKLRQRVLEKALKWREADLIVMLDMDFISFNDTDFINMIQEYLKIKNCQGIFGMSYCQIGTKLLPYDVGAIRPLSSFVSIWFQRGVIPVKSAFSGFGVYNAEVLRSKQPCYDGSKGIEHLAFNKQLNNLYVYPWFCPVYEHANNFIKSFSKLGFGLVIVGIIIWLLVKWLLMWRRRLHS